MLVLEQTVSTYPHLQSAPLLPVHRPVALVGIEVRFAGQGSTAAGRAAGTPQAAARIGGLHFFRVQDYEVALIVFETLKQAMEQANLVGPRFAPV